MHFLAVNDSKNVVNDGSRNTARQGQRELLACCSYSTVLKLPIRLCRPINHGREIVACDCL